MTSFFSLLLIAGAFYVFGMWIGFRMGYDEAFDRFKNVTSKARKQDEPL